jgi:outer membrane receptor for ferrienterochelin and colicins
MLVLVVVSGVVSRRLYARAIASGLALASLLLWRPHRAAAQEPEEYEKAIDQLDLQAMLNTPLEVWTATKTAQKTTEAPAIITTVTHEQIAVWGYRTVAEVLNHVLGFYVIDDHISPNVAVRGSSGGLYSDSSVIKLLIDGHSVAFHPTGGNQLGPELIPLTAVDRIEIIRGPASALYGADAFLGVVNIKIREGRTRSGALGWLTAGRVGAHAASDVDLTLGIARGMLDVRVAFRHTKQNLSGLELPGSSPAPSIPIYNFGSRTARGLDQESYSAIATIGLQPRAGTSLKAFGYFSSMDRGAEFGSLFQLASGFNARNTFSENRVSRWQLRSGLSWEQDLTQQLRLSLGGAYFHGGPGDGNRLEVGSEFYYVRRRFDFRGMDADGHLAWRPTESLRLVAGVSQFLDDERLPSRIGIAKQPVEQVKAGEVIDAISVYQGRKTFLNSGAYLQGTWDALGTALGVTAGVRYDRHNLYGGQVSQRVGLVSNPRSNLHAKLLHGSAFKAPSPLLLYAVPSASGDVLGNAQLRPQYVNTFELQIAYEPGDMLSLSTDVAYSFLRDRTEFIQQGINRVARNVARAATLSWESLAEVKVQEWLRARLSLELQRTLQRTGQGGYAGRVLGSVGCCYPELMVHGGLVAQPPRWPARLAVSASYIGTRRASGNNILLYGEPYDLPPYVLLDANLSTTGFKVLRDNAQEISFSLAGKNLLDADGPTPGFSGVDYPLSPRSFFVQINVTL